MNFVPLLLQIVKRKQIIECLLLTRLMFIKIFCPKCHLWIVVGLLSAGLVKEIMQIILLCLMQQNRKIHLNITFVASGQY